MATLFDNVRTIRAGETVTEPGIYDMAKEVYHADPCPEPSLSRSCVSTIMEKSAYHAWRFHSRLGMLLDPVEDDDDEAMTVGSCIDELLLGGTREIFVSPFTDNRSKDAKAVWDQAIQRGALPIKKKHFDKAAKMVETFRRRMTLKRFPSLIEEFPTGNFQKVVIWHENGVWNRAMLDTFSKHIWDYKSTKGGANPGDWIRNQLFGMRLEHQAAYYPRGFEAVTGERKHFLFAVQEQNEPFDCYPVHVDQGDLLRADQQITYCQKLWRYCLDIGTTPEKAEEWPGYASGIVHAASPPYIQTQWEEFQEREKTAAEIRAKKVSNDLDPSKAFVAG